MRPLLADFRTLAGDILMLENMLVAHGCETVVGPRKIVVAMGNMIRLQEV